MRLFRKAKNFVYFLFVGFSLILAIFFINQILRDKEIVLFTITVKEARNTSKVIDITEPLLTAFPVLVMLLGSLGSSLYIIKGFIKTIMSNQSSKYDMRGSTFGNFADTLNKGGKQQNVQHIYAAEKQDLGAATAEIQNLLNQLAESNPTSSTVTRESVHREIQNNSTLKARLTNALKSGGLEALKVIFNHPLFSIPAETVKGWLEEE
jgi:hypothetical protein